MKGVVRDDNNKRGFLIQTLPYHFSGTVNSLWSPHLVAGEKRRGRKDVACGPLWAILAIYMTNVVSTPPQYIRKEPLLSLFNLFNLIFIRRNIHPL
jgi:hypothetical protein